MNWQGAVRTIVADPPWRFRDKLPGNSRGAEKNYRTMPVKDIESFLDTQLLLGQVPEIDDECRLFLWRVASMQEEALRVMEAWGFGLRSEVVWVKKTKTGKDWFGMGRQVRMSHETCLIGIRGRPPVLSHGIRSVFAAPVGQHSRKPDAFYQLVEQLSPGPYLELFATRTRPGWICLGDEVQGTQKD